MRVFIVTSFLCLSGCVLGPDYAPPVTPDDLSFLEQSGQQLTADPTEETWWANFQDPVLTELVERALVANTDIRQATARITEVQALRRVTRSGLWPNFDSSATGSRSRSSEEGNLPPGFPTYQTLYNVGLTASWELDFFGGLRRRVEAADARLESTVEERRHLMVLVLSEVALNYTDFRSAQTQHAVALRNIDVARQTLNLAGLLEGEELATELDVVRARAEVVEAEATLAQFSSAEFNALSRLATLLAMQPRHLAEELRSNTQSSLSAPKIPVGLASDLLRRRADVRAAERRLAASSAEIGAEVATLFPRFSLTGGLSSEANELDNLFKSPADAWNVAGVLQWPILDFGRRRANIRASEARFDQAFAAYEGAVYSALSDAESAFASYVYAVIEKETLERARVDRERSLEIARLRFSAELDDLFSVLDAQRQLLALDTRLAATERAELVAAVNVYRALGGGWQHAETELMTSESQ